MKTSYFEYFRREFDIEALIRENTVVSRKTKPIINHINTYRHQEYVTPFVLSDHSIRISEDSEIRKVDSLLLVHNLNEYKRQKVQFVLLPKIDTVLGKLLNVGGEPLVIS